MKKYLVILLVALMLVPTLFISCSKKEAKSEPTATVEKTTEVKKAPEVKEEATKKAPETDAFRIFNGAEPESLDPALISGVPESRIIGALFEGLTTYNPEGGEALPGMAKSWDVSEDGKVYTFHLRDANWSDGIPVTAYDFEWSILRTLAPETASAYAWFPGMFIKNANEYSNGDISDASKVGVKALDEKTLKLELVGPLPYVLGALSHYSFFAVPKHVVEKYGDEWTQPGKLVGNGSFVLKDWKPQSYIDVVKNPKYYAAENVKLNGVRFYAIDDTNTGYNMYLNGELDWMTTIPGDKMDSASLRADYQVAPQLSAYYYVLQTEKVPTNNPLVRKALAKGFDRQALVDKVLKAGQMPAWGIVPEMVGYEALGDPAVEADVEEAKELLAEAGYPNGAGLPTLTILYNTSEGHKKIAEFIQQEWKNNLGVNVVLENQEWKTYLSTRRAGEFQIARAGWVGDYEDPNTFLDMFVKGSAMNGGKYDNPEYDALIFEAAQMPAGPERFAVLSEAENILINEDQAIIPFYYYTSNNLIDLDVWGGWYPNIMDRHPVKNIFKK